MKIPPDILQRLQDCEVEANAILDDAERLITAFDPSKVDFAVRASGPLPLMPLEIQAQSLTFIIRFDHLPEISSFVAGRHSRTGRYYLNEIDAIRAALNEYRTIFYNQRDGIYYGKITNIYQQAFISPPPGASMKFEALDAHDVDHSAAFLEHLKSRKRAIQHAIQRSDFDFIFNGVLQHSDGTHSMRMVESYTNGTLAYTLLKNYMLAKGMKDFLREHYRVIKTLNFPTMGPL